jgi:hypothetical protein
LECREFPSRLLRRCRLTRFRRGCLLEEEGGVLL